MKDLTNIKIIGQENNEHILSLIMMNKMNNVNWEFSQEQQYNNQILNSAHNTSMSLKY
jgi:hypothetical protein